MNSAKKKTTGNNITTFQDHELVSMMAASGRVHASFGTRSNPDNPTPKTVSDLVTRIVVNRQAHTMPSPCGLNCTYNLIFDAPYLSCNKSSTTMHPSIPSDSIMATVYEANWASIGPNPNEPAPQGPFYLKALQNCTEDWLSTHEPSTVTCTQETLSCYPRRAEYHVLQSFENGQQQSTVQFGEISDLVSLDGAPAPESGSHDLTWNLYANSTTAAYIRDANILGLIMSMTHSLSGSYSTILDPNPQSLTNMSNATANWTRFQDTLSWNGISYSYLTAYLIDY